MPRWVRPKPDRSVMLVKGLDDAGTGFFTFPARNVLPSYRNGAYGVQSVSCPPLLHGFPRPTEIILLVPGDEIIDQNRIGRSRRALRKPNNITRNPVIIERVNGGPIAN